MTSRTPSAANTAPNAVPYALTTCSQSGTGLFDLAVIREHVEQFSEQRFAEKLYAAVDELTSS